MAFAVLTPLDVAPADQLYEVAPVAVKLAVCPIHIEGEFTLINSEVLTVTVATAVFPQPFKVPVTVYEVVTAGEALAVLAPVLVAPEDHV